MHGREKLSSKLLNEIEFHQRGIQQLEISMQIEENDILSKSPNSSLGLDDLKAFSPHLLSNSIGTLQSSSIQRDPLCDRS